MTASPTKQITDRYAPRVQVKTRFCEGKQQEFGWLPACWYCEGAEPGYSQFNGTGRTEQEAIDDFVWRVGQEAKIKIRVVSVI